MSLTFRTRPKSQSSEEDSDEEWVPKADRRWRADRPPSPWESLAPLQAAPGVTAVSGRVLLLNGQPLANVTLNVGGRSTATDGTGRFLVTNAAAGQQTLVIDGRSASAPGRSFGVFLSRVDPRPGETTVLSYTIWMPRIDMAHAVSISSPLSSDLVVTTPRIPGLEVHVPKGSVIRDHEGRPATEIGITAIPVDRTPFPLPTGVDVPVYFTIQPGGGFIETPNTPWPSGARVVYPNFSHEPPGTDLQFWNYDPEDRGWHVYGQGTVDSAGGRWSLILVS